MLNTLTPALYRSDWETEQRHVAHEPATPHNGRHLESGGRLRATQAVAKVRCVGRAQGHGFISASLHLIGTQACGIEQPSSGRPVVRTGYREV
jgi:hypothetical protein